MRVTSVAQQDTHLLHSGQFSNDLIAVALVDQETLSFGSVLHLHSVL